MHRPLIGDAPSLPFHALRAWEAPPMTGAKRQVRLVIYAHGESVIRTFGRD
jgi:hypothetical protein